jgi:alanine racemase
MKKKRWQWVEVSRGALMHNVGQFRKLLGHETKILAVVKANAYGHGLQEVSTIVLEAGADWLGVNSVEEGIRLREAHVLAPILVLGAAASGDFEVACANDLRLTVYDRAMIEALSRTARKLKKKIPVHLKLETGTHRQGLPPEELVEFVKLVQKLPGLRLEGLSSHFANIEDTTSSTYPEYQLKIYLDLVDRLRKNRIEIPIKHMSSTASSILFPETYFDMVRIGIGLYGLWPSKETFLSCTLRNRTPLELRPVLSWKARIAQIKKVPEGSFIGYGCTYRTTRPTRLAVIPIGYYDGYSRSLSNASYVLVRGKRAFVRGRVAMNFIMSDITDIPGVKPADEVTLIGRDGKEVIPAETLASLAGTISYEILARINPLIPRVIVP